MIKVGCRGADRNLNQRDYSFDISREQINRVICFDGYTPNDNGNCKVEANEFLECGEWEEYIVEIFDLETKIKG